MLTDLKGKIDNNAITVGNFNTPLLTLDRSFTRKINKEILDLNYTLDQIELTDIYRTFHPTHQSTQYSQAHTEHFPV